MAQPAYSGLNGVNMVDVFDELKRLGYGIDNRLGQNGLGLSRPGKRRRKVDGLLLPESFGETIPHNEVEKIRVTSHTAAEAARRFVSYASGATYGGTNQQGKTLDQQVTEKLERKKEVQAEVQAALAALGLTPEKLAGLQNGEYHVQKKPGPKPGTPKKKAEVEVSEQ